MGWVQRIIEVRPRFMRGRFDVLVCEANAFLSSGITDSLIPQIGRQLRRIMLDELSL